MIDLSIDIDAKDFGFGKGFDKSAVTLIGVTAVGMIKERTQMQKVDRNGRPFIAYSEAYRRYREKNGRNGSPVDLTFTGQMVGSTRVLAKKASKKMFELVIGP